MEPNNPIGAGQGGAGTTPSHSATDDLSPARLAGHGLIGIGVAVLVCRYALWPLTVEGPTRYAIGLAVGLAIGGQLLIKTNQNRRRVLEIGALVVAGAAAAAIIFFLFAPASLGDVVLSKVEGPGLSVSIPEGDRMISGDHRHGEIAIKKNFSSGPAVVKITWSPGTGMSKEEQAAALEVLRREFGGGPFSPVGDAREVSGHEAMTHTSRKGGASIVATAWNCAEHRRTFFMMTVAHGDSADVLGLHGRIIDSLTCHVGAAPEAMWVLPGFDSGLEVGYVADSDPPMFITPDAELLIFNVSTADLPENISEHPKLIEGMFSMAPEAKIVHFDPSPTIHPSPSGGGRKIWRATLDIGGARMLAEFSPIGCESFAFSGLSFRAQTGGSGQPPSNGLLTARCPRPDDPAPRDARELAREVCMAGAVDGCAFFGEAGLSGEELEGWVREGCTAGNEAACAALEPTEATQGGPDSSE